MEDSQGIQMKTQLEMSLILYEYNLDTSSIAECCDKIVWSVNTLDT